MPLPEWRGSEIKIYEISTSITHRPFAPITSYTLMSLDAINELDLDELVGLHLAPVQIAQFHRDRRYRILPAYTQDGILGGMVEQV
jgi:hypothetical protein